ncbi:NADPH-dependent FMN reductase [Clostridium sp. ASBs410]|nr:NADPH-dependent FMN reductase [Clostridium sp. ASBs410]
MKIYAINGSPRKNFNTATMLNNFLEGAKSYSKSVETQMINLYDYDYKGCTECYMCKLKEGKSYGSCGYPDSIKDLLREVSLADGIAFGSPIFFHNISGELRCFLERLFYPYTAYKRGGARVIAPKQIHTAFIYTMNVTKEDMQEQGYLQNLTSTENWAQHIFGYKPEVIYANFTYQYYDYSKYVADLWDVDRKKAWHDTQFPIDCQIAFDAGKAMAQKIQVQK